MENQSQERSLFDLSFDENVKRTLKGAAAMAGVAAISSLIYSALIVVNYFVAKSKMQPYQYEGLDKTITPEPGIGTLIVLLIMFAFAVALFYFLNRFAQLTKKGIDSSNQQLVTDGLGGLANFFKIIGILLIIFLSLVFLGIIAGL